MDWLACPNCKCPIASTDVGRGDGYCGSCPMCGTRLTGMEGKTAEGELIGWRGVRIMPSGPNGRPRLWSPVFPLEWPTQEKVTAVCAHHGAHVAAGSPAPDAKCSCGFYAARNRQHLLSMGYGSYSTPDSPDHVLIEVAQWGKVVIADNGFRAQYCRILRIYVPSDGDAWRQGVMLAEDYGKGGTEVVMADTLNLPRGAVPAWCEECGAKMNENNPTCSFCEHYHHV